MLPGVTRVLMQLAFVLIGLSDDPFRKQNVPPLVDAILAFARTSLTKCA
jgi:hypothetical protein